MNAAADAGIHRLAIPTPFQVGPVNAYLIEDEPLTLVDSGPNSAKALDELEQALAALGHAVEDLELLVISHQHMDHFGLASILARRSGAEVAALDRLAPYLAAYSKQTDLDDRFAEGVMLRHGIPPEIVTALRAVSAGFRAWGAAVEVTRPLTDGRFRLHRRRAERIHRLIASEPRTAHEIAQELWGNVAVTQAYLTLSEVLGHVDLLLREGTVVERDEGGVVRFAAV